MFTKDTLDDFYAETGINIEGVMDRFITFVDRQRGKIVEYYSGNSRLLDVDAFDSLNSVSEEVEQLLEQFYLWKDSFSRLDYWDLLEYVEEMRLKLMTTANISKFLRSSIEKGHFNRFIEAKYSMKQNQTLEDVANTALNSLNPVNDWVDIALRNDLREEDYNTRDGKLLSVVFDQNGGITNVMSVVDNINGENINGLDIYQKFTFEDDDLKTLSYADTIKQAADIASKLRRKDNPEFPDDGIQSNAAVGNDVISISYPVIFRQLFNVFAKDDTFNSFSITNVKMEKDNLLLEAEIVTKYGDFLQSKIRP